MKRELTCIVCPVGCSLVAEFEDGKVLSVSGNKCVRGKKYAETECISPMRTVTTTVKCENGEIVPVKTDKPIPKGKMAEVMKIINATHPVLPISVGDVIIEDIFGSKLVATKNSGGIYGEYENNCGGQKR